MLIELIFVFLRKVLTVLIFWDNELDMGNEPEVIHRKINCSKTDFIVNESSPMILNLNCVVWK